MNFWKPKMYGPMNTLLKMNNIRTESDENLMVLLSQGSKPAFDEIYQRYSTSLFSFFMKMLSRDREKCEDFLQDLFMTVVEKNHYFDASRRFKPWLYSIAHNMIKNEYKKLAIRKVMDPNADGENVVVNGHSPDALADDQLFSEKLNQYLDEMDSEVKEAFILKYQQGFAIQEIADMQNVKEGTIKSRLFYAKKQLSHQLAEFKPKA